MVSCIVVLDLFSYGRFLLFLGLFLCLDFFVTYYL